MKIKFGTKLITVVIIVILLTNVIFFTNVKARDNTVYIMGTSYYFGNAATYLIDKLPFWYRRLNYNVITQDNPTTSEFWESLYADVQILDGHGDWDRFWSKDTGLIVGDSRTYDGKYHYGTNDVHWQYDTLLVVYLACQTAKNTENGLAAKTCESGADNVIGWSETVYSDDLAYWSDYFSASLAAGAGIYDAAVNANSKTYPGDDRNDTSIRKNAVFNHGDANMKLGKYRTNNLPTKTNINEEEKVSNVLDDERNILRNSKQIVEFKNVEEIIDIIKEYDQTFNEENYTISQSEGLQMINVVTGEKKQQQIIDIHLRLGEFYTNAGYVVTINDGIIEAIYDNTLLLKNRKISDKDFIVNTSVKSKSDIYKEMAKTEAVKKSETKGALEYNIIEQRQNYYYDVVTGKKYSRVRTIIETECENGKNRDYITTLFEI